MKVERMWEMIFDIVLGLISPCTGYGTPHLMLKIGSEAIIYVIKKHAMLFKSIDPTLIYITLISQKSFAIWDEVFKITSRNIYRLP